MKNRYEVDGDIVRIYLKRKNKPDLATTIDAVDLPKVAARPGSWYAAPMGKVKKAVYVRINSTYEERRQGMGNGLSVHRVIMDTPDGLYVHHKNHDTLDNRKHNLENVTFQENNEQKLFYTRRKTKGYCFCNTTKVWLVSVHTEQNKRPKQLRFKSEAEAKAEAERLLEARKLLSLKQDGSEDIWTEGHRRAEGSPLESTDGSGLVL